VSFVRLVNLWVSPCDSRAVFYHQCHLKSGHPKLAQRYLAPSRDDTVALLKITAKL